jgi:hypothetical protein
MRTQAPPRRLCRVSWTALAGAALALGVGAGNASAVALPPELQALEAKAKELKINSERFTLDYLIKSPAGKVVSVTASGEARTSPVRGEVKETVKGKTVVVRIVGSTIYAQYPGLGRLDHGRPWVRSTQSQLTSESGVNVASPTGSFSATYALLGSDAESVQKVGPVTVDGQETTEFAATVALDRLTSLLSSKLRTQLVKAGVTTAQVAIFIAPNGLPLQSVVNLAVEGGTVSVRTMILQVNGRVSVSAPPAGRTISEAAFKALEKRLKS